MTTDQKAKLPPIIQEEMVQIDAVRTDTSLTMEQKQAKVVHIKREDLSKNRGYPSYFSAQNAAL